MKVRRSGCSVLRVSLWNIILKSIYYRRGQTVFHPMLAFIFQQYKSLHRDCY